MSSDKASVKVVLDLNEPKELHEHLESDPCVEEVKLAPLSAADISIGGVGFERKTWGDFVQSMKDGRLTEQVKKMEAYEAAYILVEGDMESTETLSHTDMHPSSIRGRCASLTARDEHEVRAVIPVSSMALLADYAVRLARKHSEDPSTRYLPTGAVGSDEPRGKQMWGCLPEVGPELADRLYEEFGTPMSIAHLTEERLLSELIEVEGIGAQRANTISNELWGNENGD